ncbi:MAG: DNA repair protein RadA [Bdellovibrionaceae bacterium]|nr:DNA repair protein RadA [Pseudobdellovibrionaceae bacterium]|tara:strand:- start:178227 stop:179696 length:1470 start_codon:yes stop_codon:yes gene_type:complete
MAKAKTTFSCQECGSSFPKWEGKCRGCGAWNSLVEEVAVDTKKSSLNKRGWSVSDSENKKGSRTIKLNDKIVAKKENRTSTGFKELDRVLGGGLVKGSYALLGGDPGIGKSTLLLQMAGGLASQGLNLLYVSGEESVDQTGLRAQRLGVNSERVEVAAESQLEDILAMAEIRKPDVLIVDSIQTVYLAELQSAPGSVSQVRECAARLMSLAKSSGISVFLIGHVTKDGNIAGPKVLEHMVDTVLSFEGDNSHQFRLLRALKNRFGATNELGVFQMEHAGLMEVTNPSEFFLEERGVDSIGSSVFAALEGTRPLLCEVQALTTQSTMHNPRRTALGFDVQRVHLLLAVLERHSPVQLIHHDVFVNIVGGLKLTEPCADLAVAAALISSSQMQEINASTCFFGEVGLTGEIRAASFPEDRLREAQKLGFTNFVLPFSNKKHLKSLEKKLQGRCYWIKNINQLQPILKTLAEESLKKSSPKKIGSPASELDI